MLLLYRCHIKVINRSTTINWSIIGRFHQLRVGALDYDPTMISAREQCDGTRMGHEGLMKNEIQKKKRQFGTPHVVRTPLHRHFAFHRAAL